MTGEQLFVALNRQLDNCKAECVSRRGQNMVRYRQANGEVCKATYICSYPKTRILEMGRDLLTALGLSEVERTRILEDLRKFMTVNKPEGLGCKRLLTTSGIVRNVAIGTESLQRVSGHIPVFEASRGC